MNMMVDHYFEVVTIEGFASLGVFNRLSAAANRFPAGEYVSAPLVWRGSRELSKASLDLQQQANKTEFISIIPRLWPLEASHECG